MSLSYLNQLKKFHAIQRNLSIYTLESRYDVKIIRIKNLQQQSKEKKMPYQKVLQNEKKSQEKSQKCSNQKSFQKSVKIPSSQANQIKNLSKEFKQQKSINRKINNSEQNQQNEKVTHQERELKQNQDENRNGKLNKIQDSEKKKEIALIPESQDLNTQEQIKQKRSISKEKNQSVDHKAQMLNKQINKHKDKHYESLMKSGLVQQNRSSQSLDDNFNSNKKRCSRKHNRRTQSKRKKHKKAKTELEQNDVEEVSTHHIEFEQTISYIWCIICLALLLQISILGGSSRFMFGRISYSDSHQHYSAQAFQTELANHQLAGFNYQNLEGHTAQEVSRHEVDQSGETMPEADYEELRQRMDEELKIQREIQFEELSPSQPELEPIVQDLKIENPEEFNLNRYERRLNQLQKFVNEASINPIIFFVAAQEVENIQEYGLIQQQPEDSIHQDYLFFLDNIRQINNS